MIQNTHMAKISIVHHGSESKYKIVCGLMGFGNRQSSSNEIRMNLGGPGIETFG